LRGYQRNSNKLLNPLQLLHTILQIRFYKAIAAITAAPIIPAPTLKPLPALVVAVAGLEVEATEAADEVAVVAEAAVDAEDTEALEDTAVVVADDALEATDATDETADDEAEVAVDAAVVALVEAPLARAIEQISLVTLVVAVA